MKISKWVFVSLVCLVVFALGWSKIPASAFGKSQAPEVGLANKPHSVPGYLDLQTGLFTAAQTTAPAPAVAFTHVIFRLIFNFNLEFNDQPSNNTLACNVFISSSEGNTQKESAVGLSSDGGKTCQATILAQWNLVTPATDTIRIGYEIMASPTGSDGQPIAFPNFFFFPPSSTLRDSEVPFGNLPSIPMPANGQTITQPTITVVL